MAERRPKAVLSRTEAGGAEKLPNLYEFIPRLGRTFTPPRHLDPLVQSLERAWTEPVYQTGHAPPRHAKTDTVLAWCALTLKRQPWRTIAYITYEAKIARSKSRKARTWALAAGVKLADDAQALTEWRTREGGGFLAGGIGGPLTSHGVDILLIDDPYKNRQQAESPAYGQMVTDWWGDVADTRIEPGGSAFIFHTRWTSDDMIAHVLDGEGADLWEPHIRLPAIDDAGRALWPERWPVEALDRKRRSGGPLTWASLFQGLPRPRGGAVFNGTKLYTASERPQLWDALAIGADFAYSSKKSADYSVAVVLARVGTRYYVLEVLREQCSAPAFRKKLRALSARYGGAPVNAYVGGTEEGIVDFLEELETNEDEPLRVNASPARADKLVRAQPVAAAWNDGRVLIPAHGDTIAQFTSEVLAFTGVRDANDDCIDALAPAYDALTLGEVEFDPSYDDYLPQLRA